MSNRALFLLRSLAAATRDGIDNPYLPNQLRFALELPPDGRSAAERMQALRAPLAALVDSPRFLLEPMFSDDEPNESVFLVLAFPGVERTLPPEILFAMAAELRIALHLTSCEPDLGADVFVDPEPQRLGTTESAVVDAMCWVEGEAPANRQWALENIRVPQAWALSPLKGKGIRVAQPDTGITDHPEIQDAQLRLADALNILEGGTDPTDPLNASAANPGHGTATGSVLASGTNGQIVGAAPNAELIPIRCLDDVKVFDGTPVAKAIDHARKVSADVISMSLGGTPSRSVRKAIAKAVDADMIVVAAAGNCVGLVVWPAQYDDVIAVGGTNIQDKKWKGSSSGGAVAISAPAELVWRAERKSTADPPAQVSGGQGTSFATALTAGVAALWLAHFGRLAVRAQARARNVRVQELFRAALRQTARRPADWNSGKLGAGIVDAAALLALPLAQIAVGSRARASDAEAFGQVLEAAQGPGTVDPVFDWAAHGLEVASLVLADAKSGRDLSAGRREARAFDREASEGLIEAAQVSADSRLAALALRARRPARQPLPPPADPSSNERLIRKLGSQPGSVPLSLESAQSNLAPRGRDALMESVQRRVDPVLRGSAATEIGQIAAGIDQLHARGSAARLSVEQRVGLEALVKLTERPALTIVDRGGAQTLELDLRNPTADQLADLGEFQGLLMLALSDIETRMLSVGRIDADGAHSGTGFVVASDLVMTNRHVAETIAAPLPRATRPERWLLTREASIDFSPLANDPTRRFRISDVVFAGPDPILGQRFDAAHLDLALLRVETTNAMGRALPAILPLSQALLGLQDPNIIVCGYPAAPQSFPTTHDGRVRMDVVERLRAIFGLRYGRKYLSPGRIEGNVDAISFDHDATTLPGNSGSCVMRLSDGVPVCGLHFAGLWLETNYAHALQAVRAGGTAPPLADLTWV